MTCPAPPTCGKSALQTGQTYNVDFRIRRAADGAYRWHTVCGVPVCGPDGQITRWFGTATDIHDHKLVEDALRDSDSRYRTLIENLPDYAIFMVDTTGCITHWTEGAQRH